MVAYDWTCVVNPNPTYKCIYCNFHVMPGEARIVPRCGCYICNACCNYISCCPAHRDSLIRPSTLQETSLEISQAISNVDVRCLYHLDGCLWGGLLGAANGHNSSCPNRYTPRLPPVHLRPFAAKLREILHTNRSGTTNRMPATVLRTLILSKKEIPRAFLTDTMSQSGDKLVGEITIMKSVSENGRTDFWIEGGGEEPLQPPNPEVWMWKDTVIPKVPNRRQRQNVHQQNQPRPIVQGELPQPTIQQEQPRPTVQLEQRQPTIKQEHPRPAVQLEQPQPTIKQEHPRPAVQLEQRPTVQVDRPRLSVQSPHTLLYAMHKTLLEFYERNLNEALVAVNAATDTNGPQYTEAMRKITNVTSSIHDMSSRVGRDKTLLEFYERNLNEALVELNAATDTNGPQYTEAKRKIANVTSSIHDLSSRLGREHGI